MKNYSIPKNKSLFFAIGVLLIFAGIFFQINDPLNSDNTGAIIVYLFGACCIFFALILKENILEIILRWCLYISILGSILNVVKSFFN